MHDIAQLAYAWIRKKSTPDELDCFLYCQDLQGNISQRNFVLPEECLTLVAGVQADRRGLRRRLLQGNPG